MTTPHRRILFSILLALPALLYVVYRAIVLDFTYDECWTFLGYAQAEVWPTLINQYPAANNHILHSLLMKVTFTLFGMEEIALRLPVVCALVGYVSACFVLLKDVKWHLHAAIMIAMIYQPYLLDYFVAARGYALAIAFTTWALVYLYKFSEKQRSKDLLWTLIFALLAAWSNFTYILHLVAIILALTWLVYKHDQLRKFYVYIGSAIVLAGLLFTYPILKLIQADELYYGGREGFFVDTLSSVSSSFFYYQLSGIWTSLAVGLLLFGTFAWWLWELIKKPANSLFLWTGWLVFIPLLGSVLQHFLLDSPYPIDRTALYVMPLLIMTLMLGIARETNMKSGGIILFVLSALSLVNVVTAANFTHLVDFKEYADTEQAMKWLEEHDNEFQGTSYKIGKSVYLNAPINYYKIKLGIDRLEYTGLEYCDDGAFPVYYLFHSDLSCVDSLDIDTVRHFPVSNTYLLTRNK